MADELTSFREEMVRAEGCCEEYERGVGGDQWAWGYAKGRADALRRLLAVADPRISELESQLAEAREAGRECWEALGELMTAAPAFRSKPVGGAGSLARMGQQLHAEAEDKARASYDSHRHLFED